MHGTCPQINSFHAKLTTTRLQHGPAAVSLFIFPSITSITWGRTPDPL